MPVALPPPDEPQVPSGGPRVPPGAPGSRRQGRGRMLQSYGSFAGLGLQFAGSLTAFTLAGLWLDRQLGSLPWLLLTGVAIGLLTGMWLLIKRAG